MELICSFLAIESSITKKYSTIGIIISFGLQFWFTHAWTIPIFFSVSHVYRYHRCSNHQSHTLTHSLIPSFIPSLLYFSPITLTFCWLIEYCLFSSHLIWMNVCARRSEQKIINRLEHSNVFVIASTLREWEGWETNSTQKSQQTKYKMWMIHKDQMYRISI